MAAFLAFLAGFAGYSSAGLAVYAALARIVPEQFFVDSRSQWCNKCHRQDTEPRLVSGDWDPPFMVVLGWPVFVFLGAARVVERSSIKAHNGKLKLRAELERELAAARAEVDELLGRKAP